MMIRTPWAYEIGDIMGLCERARGRSKYGAFAEIDWRQLRALLANVIAAQGDPAPGFTYVRVTGEVGAIDGVMIGLARPLYEVTDILVVSNMFWYVDRTASAKAGPALMRGLEQWAETAEGKCLLRVGINDAISNVERTGRFLERQGMREIGNFYEKEM